MTPIDTEVTVDSVYCNLDCDGFKSGYRISVVGTNRLVMDSSWVLLVCG